MRVHQGVEGRSVTWHPDDLPEGYHATARGQAWAPDGGSLGAEVAPSPRRDRATPGRRDATKAPASCGARGRRSPRTYPAFMTEANDE